jgi:hypothetical protein
MADFIDNHLLADVRRRDWSSFEHLPKILAVEASTKDRPTTLGCNYDYATDTEEVLSQFIIKNGTAFVHLCFEDIEMPEPGTSPRPVVKDLKGKGKLGVKRESTSTPVVTPLPARIKKEPKSPKEECTPTPAGGSRKRKLTALEDTETELTPHEASEVDDGVFAEFLAAGAFEEDEDGLSYLNIVVNSKNSEEED